MNTVVNKLLDVDREARQLLDEAQQYYDHTLKEVETEKERLRTLYDVKARSHIHALETELENEVREVVDAVNKRAAKLSTEMETQYNDYHRQWEDALFEKTVSG